MITKVYHVEKSELRGRRRLMKVLAKIRGLTFVFDYSHYVDQTKVIIKGDGRRISRFAKDIWGWS